MASTSGLSETSFPTSDRHSRLRSELLPYPMQNIEASGRISGIARKKMSLSKSKPCGINIRSGSVMQKMIEDSG
jgi:hypothetical protein